MDFTKSVTCRKLQELEKERGKDRIILCICVQLGRLARKSIGHNQARGNSMRKRTKIRQNMIYSKNLENSKGQVKESIKKRGQRGKHRYTHYLSHPEHPHEFGRNGSFCPVQNQLQNIEVLWRRSLNQSKVRSLLDQIHQPTA